MKKLKKILALTIILTSIGIIGTHYFNAFAAPGDNLVEDELDKVSKTQCNMVSADYRYGANVELSNETSSNVTIDISITKGVFDVYIYEIKNDDSGNTWAEQINYFTLGGTNGSLTKHIDYAKASEPKHFEIVFNLKEADELCGVTTGSTPVRNNETGAWNLSTGSIGYVYYHQIDLGANTTNIKTQNINYNGICAALRNGDYDSYASQFQSVGLSKGDFTTYYQQAYNYESFTYCRSEYVDSNVKESNVATMIKNIITTIKIASTGNTSGSLAGPDEGEIITIGPDESTDLSSTPIQCPAYKEDEYGNMVPNQSSTVKKYYKTVTTVKNMDIYPTVSGNDAKCIKTCEENVTVTYGPPVASKAGLCFEYKVKVESKLSCQTTFEADEPTPDDYEVCTPSGSCNGGALRSASGPTEEFDSCVNACDGGKYTQSCIDSCYEEVYESTTDESLSLSLNYSDKPVSTKSAIINRQKVQKLVSASTAADILSSPNQIGPGKKYSYEDLRTALTEYGTGYYYVSGGSIAWHSGSTYWDRPGRYFSIYLTEYTVGRLKSAGRANASWNNQDGLSVIDSGFLRNNYGTSVCMAACSWSGCDEARTNGFYKNWNATEATNRQFLNADDYSEVLELEQEAYEAAKIDCAASASCTTQVSEFTIKVNNKTNADPEVDNWIDYQTSINEYGNLNETTVNGNSLNNSTIILDRSGCYTPDENNGQATYMTEWSFPGTWVNNKTGKISYQPISGNAWHVKKEKFCTNLDSKYVNTEWWNHRVKNSTTHFATEDQAVIDEYNIIATAKDFGYFKWDFNINCFYALYDSEASSTDTGTDEDLEPLSYKARTVELTDLFPDNEDETETTNPNDTGREQGYNWTDDASNIKNSDYEVTPGALYPVIQARGSEIYDEDKKETYLDYEFYLTPSDLNKIRNYSKNDANDNFSTYPGKINVANGIAYYESALFRSSSSSSYKLDSDSIITLGALGVNNQKSKGSNQAEVFTNSYVAEMFTARDLYLNAISGGNTNE